MAPSPFRTPSPAVLVAMIPGAHFRRKSDKLTTGTAVGPATLAGLHPEKNERYGWNDIGSGNLFADWYRDRRPVRTGAQEVVCL